jgi:hypothetical protein
VEQLLVSLPGDSKQQFTRMKVTILSVACLAALTISAPVPEADPDAFVNLGAVAIPAITGSALIDGLLLGKVAFLKAAILANLLLGSESADEAADAYGAPAEVQDSYGAPAPAYEEPAPAYEEPAYAPPAAVETYGAPAAAPVDTYGSPAAEALPSYSAPAYAAARY